MVGSTTLARCRSPSTAWHAFIVDRREKESWQAGSRKIITNDAFATGPFFLVFAGNYRCPIFFRGPKFGVVNLGFRYALREENGATSAVHPESPL